MKYPIYIKEEQVKQLEYEVISKELRIRLTRELLHWSENVEYIDHIIARKNKLINLSRTISGGKIYVLTADDMGNYEQVEYDWHDSNFLLIFRTLSSIELIEFLSEILKLGHIEKDFVNKLLEKENSSFRFIEIDDEIGIEILQIRELENSDGQETHPNIRVLVKRMDSAFDNKDYSGVLHSSASIFETLAKEIVGISTIQNKTLKSFFDRYRNDSKLPQEILDLILNIYNNRNSEPLAGHGSLSKPSIYKEQALVLCEMTKAFVKIEYRLRVEE